jgi:hypothetical protein
MYIFCFSSPRTNKYVIVKKNAKPTRQNQTGESSGTKALVDIIVIS